ncbi:MAG: LytTR family transcriptional regulator DNA-binding domain-containing protein [Defluviitaleaceae bacterium]|nr:LytTR family transcriptional regulator DNA-binding domain-containing protein [Defluviitaleaceae bacterium]MCL2273923.1 LytTR family transcriptional regulator DNA-binding domain-containing protein [Defluviitaleaceae bacterium]
MPNVAICNCPNSRRIIEEKITDFLGTAAKYTFYEFATIHEMLAIGLYFDMAFLNKNLLHEMDSLVKYLQNEMAKENRTHKERFSFVHYVDDPISDEDCTKTINYIRQHLAYTSMYLAVEFLTDKGLRSIAIDKILFFEFFNRKIRIKTASEEFFCDDTLRNVLSLFGTHGFYQVHKGFIVSLKHIRTVKNYIITLNDGSQIPLSQKKSSAFRKEYKAFCHSASYAK